MLDDAETTACAVLNRDQLLSFNVPGTFSWDKGNLRFRNVTRAADLFYVGQAAHIGHHTYTITQVDHRRGVITTDTPIPRPPPKLTELSVFVDPWVRLQINNGDGEHILSVEGAGRVRSAWMDEIAARIVELEKSTISNILKMDNGWIVKETGDNLSFVNAVGKTCMELSPEGMLVLY